MTSEMLKNKIKSLVGYVESSHKDELLKGALMALVVIHEYTIEPLHESLAIQSKANTEHERTMARWAEVFREIEEYGAQ